MKRKKQTARSMTCAEESLANSLAWSEGLMVMSLRWLATNPRIDPEQLHWDPISFCHRAQIQFSPVVVRLFDLLLWNFHQKWRIQVDLRSFWE